jgi:hypothetical protein
VIKIPGESTEEQAYNFLVHATQDKGWAQESLINFLNYEKKRVLVDKSITAGTLANYYQAAKLFFNLHSPLFDAV